MGLTLPWQANGYLRWSGWLQFFPTLFLSIAATLAASAAARLGFLWVYGLLAFLAALLAGLLLFDVATIKLGAHPVEPLPKPPNFTDPFDVILRRRSCRAFQDRRLTAAHLQDLLHVSEVFVQQSRLLGEAPIRLVYVQAPLTVWPVVGAQEFLVALVPKQYDRMSVLDVGRSLQRVVLHATSLGVATCWIGPGTDHQSVIAALGPRYNSDKERICCVCAMGYASRYVPSFVAAMQRFKSRSRLPLRSLFFADAEFHTPLDTGASPFRRYERCFEACRWAPSSTNAQPVRCMAVPSKRRFDFFAASASRYYTPVAVGIWLANWEVGCEALGIKGRFLHLDEKERTPGGRSDLKLPSYDMSWVELAEEHQVPT
ncbi:unnamed protein product [Symbiodinium natans]|uniref:Putative nitroreductase TM1586 domain-containing protein n=1 Tax=Symbiodinium natans TaxID=878477 RepID=A0A812TTZ8_9DINO|nr:unnamed protein product [Symbiodinium natans]